MRVLVSIDDTDNIDSRGTGDLASMIASAIEAQGWGKSAGVTRHQLLVHPDIPYTSHNSSMCFAAELEDPYFEALIDFATGFLARESAPGSDPGLCIAQPGRLTRPDLLLAFGQKAKQEVITKQKAYDLAEQLGIHLSEHGGTGQGVIGALAGAGLRLSGNDGRFKGKFHIDAEHNVLRVRELLAHPKVDLVQSMDGLVLSEDELVRLGDKLKTVLLAGKSVLLVSPAGAENKDAVRWQTCSKQQLKRF